ncbi:MAG: DUF1887 family protein [Chloroflexaceae bacterium]|nr:DUF1887 family protein [Chloroflexaceae bacterium]
MTDPFERYRTDTLILLVGGNPLPNYVAAHLLAHPASQIVLIHSEGTHERAKLLEQVLRCEGRTATALAHVNEADPASIFQQVQAVAQQHPSGSIGLNYTGGTKAMSVHAYRALEQARPQAIFSYLDARRLSMVIDRTDCLPIEQRVAVSLDTLLELHGLGSKKQQMKRETPAPALPTTRAALLKVHTDKQQHKDWRKWCQQHLRCQDGRHKSDGDLNKLTIDDVTVPDVQAALAQLQAWGWACTVADVTVPDIKAALQHDAPGVPLLKDILKRKGSGIAKWLEGDWFEEYVFGCVQACIADRAACDLAMTINPTIGSTDFEFDIGFMYGHQFFGISVTTDHTKSLCKSKLLEAVVRTEQLGGAEARCALVCCANAEIVDKLKDEVQGLPNETLIRVFGAQQIDQLAVHLDQWITEASQGA